MAKVVKSIETPLSLEYTHTAGRPHLDELRQGLARHGVVLERRHVHAAVGTADPGHLPAAQIREEAAQRRAERARVVEADVKWSTQRLGHRSK